MNTLEALLQLQQASFSLLNAPVPVSVNAEPIKKQLQFITELTFIYILKLLGVEDEKKLAEIVSRLREGTPFYDFTFLAHNLAKSKTDFDFLSSPENIPVYAKIAEVSRECGIVLLPYVNVLARIAENKQYGLYSENQEVGFFLDEYWHYKDSADVKEFLHQFKKILKYETQKLFEQFISDGIFSLIQQTLFDYAEKIASEQTLAIYVYCLHYYASDISNADENFLHEHIRFCVSYLASHGEIEFKPIATRKIFPKFESEEDSLNYFFHCNKDARNSLESFCGLLKDICPSEDAIEFCDFLRENLYKQNATLLDEGKNTFTRLLTRTIREKAMAENILLYKNICKLLPEKIICQHSPHFFYHGGKKYFHFFDRNEIFLFYADENGCMNSKTPVAHTLVELEILKKGEKGYVVEWNWHTIESEKNPQNKADNTRYVIEYMDAVGNVTKRTIDFEGLIKGRSADWQIYAYCHLRNDYRQFKIANIRRLWDSFGHEISNPVQYFIMK